MEGRPGAITTLSKDVEHHLRNSTMYRAGPPKYLPVPTAEKIIQISFAAVRSNPMRMRSLGRQTTDQSAGVPHRTAQSLSNFTYTRERSYGDTTKANLCLLYQIKVFLTVVSVAVRGWNEFVWSSATCKPSSAMWLIIIKNHRLGANGIFPALAQNGLNRTPCGPE